MTRRLLASYLLLTLGVLLVLEIPLGLNFADREELALSQSLQIDAFALASYSEEVLEDTANHGDGDPDDGTAAGEQIDLQAIADSYSDRTGARVVIIDADGLAVADSDPIDPGDRYFDTRPEFATALEGQVASGTRTSETLGGRLLYAAVPVASGGVVHGAVRLTFPAHELDERIRQNWLRLGMIALVSLGAASVVGIVLARSVTRPVRDLQRAATVLGEGDLTVRADTSRGPSEVRVLAADFNDMADRLERLIEAQEAFVADASHQLRSPLTALRLRLENLEETVDETDRGEVEAAGREVARLARLVQGLLALARADRVSGVATAQGVDLDALLHERAEVWRPLAEERDVSVLVEADGFARANPDRLVQAVDNLLANALEVAPSGSTITFASTVSAGGADVEIHVIDEGPGLSDEDRERAFDRFWRAGRDGGTLGGTGLGLAIVQKLVRVDGGTVELRRSPAGGIDATITLPTAPAAPSP